MRRRGTVRRGFEWGLVIALALLMQGMMVFRLLGPAPLVGSWSGLMSALVLGLSLGAIVSAGIRHVTLPAVLTALLAAFGAYLLGRYWASPADEYGYWKIANFFILAVVPSLVIAWSFGGRSQIIRLFMWALALFALVPAVFVAVIIVVYHELPLRWMLQESGFDLIGISRSLGVGTVICVVTSRNGKGLVAFSMLAAGVLFFVLQVVVGERGPVLASLIAVVTMVLASLRKADGPQPGSWLGRVAGALVAAGMAAGMVALWISRTQDGGEERRFEIVSKGWSDWIAQPLFGIGVGRFRFVDGIDAFREYVHCLPFEILVETGLVGLLIASAYFLVPWWIPRGDDRSVIWAENLAPIGLYVFATAASIVSGDLATNAPVWVYGTVAVISIRLTGTGTGRIS